MIRNDIEYLYPKWNEEYSFRIYPPKMDIQYLNGLPDPNETFGNYCVAPLTELTIS